MAGRKNRAGYSVRRLKYRDRDGQERETPKWHASFIDHTRTWRRLPGFTDYSASMAYARKLSSLAAMKAAHEPISGDLAAFVDGLTEQARDKLIAWGILSGSAALATRPIDEHIDAWHAAILGRRKSKRHATEQAAQVRRIVKGCNFQRFADINLGDMERWLAEARDFGTSTRNHYARSIKSFAAWMVNTGRASRSPLAGLKMLNVEDDRKYERRAFSVDELRWLIATTDKADKLYLETTGPERALIYQLAAETGLRANEVRSLTSASFELDGDKPTVAVEAKASKRRKRDVLPLGADLAAKLRLHLKAKLPGVRAFNLPDKAAKMLRSDLTAARAAWVKAARPPKARAVRLKSRVLERMDERGRVADFHSLRVSFITNLCRGGVHPKRAQVLARHSSIDLTMNVYTEIGDDEQREAIESLPALKLAKGA